MTDSFKDSSRVGSDDGFSLLELLSVLLLTSILLLIVLYRNPIDPKDLMVETDLLKSNLRFVQQLALNQDQASMRIEFLPDQYTLSKNGSNHSLPFPTGEGPVHHLHPNLRLAVETGGRALFQLEFDRMGGIITHSEAGHFTVTLADNRTGAAESFRIIQNTGYIP